MGELHQLTGLQIAILRVLWQRGEASVSDICEALRPDRALAQTTVATVLSRLEKRGVVTHRREARQFLYRTAVSEDDVRGSMVNELTDQLFHGDVAELVNHLLAERDIGANDLARVKKLIEAHEQGTEVSRDQ
jgi:predicted transcriptional regulator